MVCAHPGHGERGGILDLITSQYRKRNGIFHEGEEIGGWGIMNLHKYRFVYMYFVIFV